MTPTHHLLTMLTCNSTARTFSGKVRKLKQHRRASASRLRPSDPPPSAPMVRATPGQTEPQQAESSQHTPGHAQQDVPAQHAKHAQQMPRMMPEQLQQQPGFENMHAHHMPIVQHPGFDLHQQSQQQLQGQVAEMPYQRGHFERGHKHMLQSQNSQQDMQFQAQVHRRLPDQFPAQQLQQQLSVVRGSRRHRPAADAAAGLACFGKAVQDTEAGRMTQSGPLQSGLLQDPSGAAAVPVPELLEVVIRFSAAMYSMISTCYMCCNGVMSPMQSHATSPKNRHEHSHSLGMCFQQSIQSLTGKKH